VSDLCAYCDDCGRETFHELHEYSFIVREHIWTWFAPEAEYLCVGCLEDRMGRKLSVDDFDPDVPLNFYPLQDSPQLAERKQGLRPSPLCRSRQAELEAALRWG
jgi:hypothetical protein